MMCKYINPPWQCRPNGPEGQSTERIFLSELTVLARQNRQVNSCTVVQMSLSGGIVPLRARLKKVISYH